MIMKKSIITLFTGLLALTATAKGLSILDIKHSITDDNIVAPESFETKTRELQENFYLKHYAARKPTNRPLRRSKAILPNTRSC